MSVSEETGRPAEGKPIKTLFATIGGLATAGLIGVSALTLLSEDAKVCSAQDYSAVICAAGAVGLVDLPALAARDSRLVDLSARITARDGEVEALKSRLGETEGRLKDLDAAQATAKAATAEVEKLRGEIARRDAKISELTDRVTAAKRPDTPPVPVARPTPPRPAKP